jgi:hypothetical protein
MEVLLLLSKARFPLLYGITRVCLEVVGLENPKDSRARG